jgi:hypothetical protein
MALLDQAKKMYSEQEDNLDKGKKKKKNKENLQNIGDAIGKSLPKAVEGKAIESAAKKIKPLMEEPKDPLPMMQQKPMIKEIQEPTEKIVRDIKKDNSVEKKPLMKEEMYEPEDEFKRSRSYTEKEQNEVKRRQSEERKERDEAQKKMKIMDDEFEKMNEEKRAWEEKQNQLKSKAKKYVYKQVSPGKVEKVEVED